MHGTTYNYKIDTKINIYVGHPIYLPCGRIIFLKSQYHSGKIYVCALAILWLGWLSTMEQDDSLNLVFFFYYCEKHGVNQQKLEWWLNNQKEILVIFDLFSYKYKSAGRLLLTRLIQFYFH